MHKGYGDAQVALPPIPLVPKAFVEGKSKAKME